MKDLKDIKRYVCTTINNYPDIELVIIYGSAVQNRLTLSSDVDIAIGSSHVITNQILLEISTTLSLLIELEASVIDINKMEGLIIEEVLTKGDIVKNSNPDLLFSHIQRMQTYTEDILPFQQQGAKKLLKDYLNDE
ncbi:nucleotidyltransferase domain-containing protein [Thiospirochaeta perfilievii]|uniref:Nucleotidyltransferase domain-containing protein n=1 Tax=Thiospirochaeta perfilievii TaxID=252967 RepID=A0A5C1QB21_9SPIO|nr:nucleotidyltransferase domain-containing protein [Thiospirochaeta perfilievii]QEN05323.1 nucleotidyltransferase domain-containing protein [Thiospirochaeta perfilievii]